MGAPDWLLRGALCLAACGKASPADGPTQLEAAIDRGLRKRFGVSVVTTCTGLVPPCQALLPDGTALPIELRWKNGGWDWRVRGLVITTDELEVYLRDELADLGAPQRVRCAPRIRRIVANERIECWLEQGGKAFIDVHADGTTAVEMVLDAAGANARSEVVTPERERELAATSRALAHMADDEEDDEGPSPPDAGDTR